MEFNASSEHQCGPGLITGGLKLARSKRVLELNMSLYVGQFLWRQQCETENQASNCPV